MNTRTFKVVSLLWAAMALCLLVGQTEGIVCSPGVCEQETCEPIDESTCDGIVKPRATFCQCCPACIRLLRENDSCFSLLLSGGGPPKAECAKGLYCDPSTTKCVPLQAA
uniref:Putative fungal protease inhibitor-1 n=2 Tax=Rhipicephalus microplus TaxID=6941 RepID=A0A6M2CKB1_RHIMP